MPAARRHLLADHDLDGQVARPGDGPRRVGGVDALVVGDGDHVELRALHHEGQDLLDAAHAVGGERVDVEVGAPVGLVRVGAVRRAQEARAHVVGSVEGDVGRAPRDSGPTASQIG